MKSYRMWGYSNSKDFLHIILVLKENSYLSMIDRNKRARYIENKTHIYISILNATIPYIVYSTVLQDLADHQGSVSILCIKVL